jgi:hypothetical protein
LLPVLTPTIHNNSLKGGAANKIFAGERHDGI